jgi:hypothetical protein
MLFVVTGIMVMPWMSTRDATRLANARTLRAQDLQRASTEALRRE